MKYNLKIKLEVAGWQVPEEYPTIGEVIDGLSGDVGDATPLQYLAFFGNSLFHSLNQYVDSVIQLRELKTQVPAM